MRMLPRMGIVVPRRRIAARTSVAGRGSVDGGAGIVDKVGTVSTVGREDDEEEGKRRARRALRRCSLLCCMCATRETGRDCVAWSGGTEKAVRNVRRRIRKRTTAL